jgi:hypothetical protein
VPDVHATLGVVVGQVARAAAVGAQLHHGERRVGQRPAIRRRPRPRPRDGGEQRQRHHHGEEPDPSTSAQHHLTTEASDGPRGEAPLSRAEAAGAYAPGYEA